MLLEETAEWVQIYRTEPEQPKIDSVINDAGLALIKEFEGLRLGLISAPLVCGRLAMAPQVSTSIKVRSSPKQRQRRY